MKMRKVWMAAVAAGCLAAGAAWGQQASGLGLGLSGFYWHGEDLGEFDLDGFAGIRFSGSGRIADYFEILGRVGVGGASVDGWERDWHGYRYDWDYTYTIVPIEVGLMLRLPLGGEGGPMLYAGPGVGCYLSWQEVTYWRGHRYEEYDDSDLEADFGAWAAVGLRLPLASGVYIDVNGEYHWLESEVEWEDVDGHDVKSDIDLNGWGFGVGLTVEF